MIRDDLVNKMRLTKFGKLYEGSDWDMTSKQMCVCVCVCVLESHWVQH